MRTRKEKIEALQAFVNGNKTPLQKLTEQTFIIEISDHDGNMDQEEINRRVAEAKKQNTTDPIVFIEIDNI